MIQIERHVERLVSENRLSCPACSGPKTARATLCHSCRGRAIDVGISAVIRAHTLAGRDPLTDEITGGQIRAIHGMAAAIDRAYGRPRRTTHDVSLEHATQIFGRGVTSVNDLDELEAGVIADWLNEQLVALERAGKIERSTTAPA